MNPPITISELQADAQHFVRSAEKQGALPITRHGKTVAFLVSKDRMEAIIETLEIMGTPKAIKAIRAYERGKSRFKKFA
jgi:prevent-host-death family protein